MTQAHRALAAVLVMAGFIGGCNHEDSTENPPAGDGTLVASMSLPATIFAGTPDTLRVRGGHAGASGDTTWAAGIAVSVAVTGGTAGATSGVTDAGGYFTTTVTADMLPAALAPVVVAESLLVEVTVSDAAADSVVDSQSTDIWEHGLLAQYSTGNSYLEGPVFNGYWADCSGTGNNYYQGVCTPAADCPVDWAWGSFSATWDGYLYSEAGGDIYFTSWYWVDGIVYIEVDGQVVADLATTGGGYGATIALPAETWVPVHMTFAGNGGSNNMQIGWPAAGSPAWAAIPREDLATPRSWVLHGPPAPLASRGG